MERKVIIAGNWKMNKDAAAGKELVEALKPLVADIKEAEIVVCPPFTTLNAVVAAAANTNIKVGAQNVHWAENGAFTGEISAEMLVSSGVEYVIIGHSERRQYFGETDATVNARMKAALKAGLKVIVCVGETLEEREGNKTSEVIGRQIKEGFADIAAADMANVIVAYEPVWAIGTGKTATPEMAEETHKFIRETVAAIFGGDVAGALRIQYGGSMKPENARELVAQADIDGGLIGGAALKADSFAKLITEAIGR
jgi:triosephosphate isomerase